MAKRPEVLNKIFQLSSERDEKDRQVYIDFLQQVSVSRRAPKGISVDLCWYEEDFHPTKIRNCSLCAIFYFYSKVQSLQQKLKSNLFTSESGDYARDALSFYEFLLFCRDWRIVPRLVTKDEILFLWRVLITEKVRSTAKNGHDTTFLLNLDGFKDILSRIAILTYNKPGIRKMVVSAHGDMPSLQKQIEALISYMHLDDIRWVKNRINTVSTATVTKINSRSDGDEKNPQTKIDLRADLRAKRLSKLLSKGDDDSAATSTASPTGAKVTANLDASQVNQVATSVRFNVHGLEPAAASSFPGLQWISDLGTAEEPSSKAKEGHRTSLDDLVDLLLGRDGGMRGERSQEGAKKEVEVGRSGGDMTPRGNEVVESKATLDDYKKAAQLGHTRRIHICHSQENALAQYRPSLSSAMDDFADVLAYKRHKKYSSDATDSKQSSHNFLDMGSVRAGAHCVIRLGIVNRTSHDAEINVWTEGFCQYGPVRVTSHPHSMAPGLTKVVYVSFTAEDMAAGRRNATGVIYVQASHKLAHRGNTFSHNTLPSEFMAACPVLFRVVRNTDVASQFPICTEHSVDRLSDEYIPHYGRQKVQQMTYTKATNSYIFPSVPDFSSSAVIRPVAAAVGAPGPEIYGFSSVKSRSRKGSPNGKDVSGNHSRVLVPAVSNNDILEEDAAAARGVLPAPPPPRAPRSATADKKLRCRSAGKVRAL